MLIFHLKSTGRLLQSSLTHVNNDLVRCAAHGGRRIRLMTALSFGNPSDRAFFFPASSMPRGASNVAFQTYRTLVVRHLTISIAVCPGSASPRPAANHAGTSRRSRPAVHHRPDGQHVER